MSEAIRKLYSSKGLTSPDGKGIHTKKFHDIASSIMAQKKAGKSGAINPYAIAMSQLGKAGAVKKEQRRFGNPRTEAERKIRHKSLFGTTKVPRRGTGKGNIYQEAIGKMKS